MVPDNRSQMTDDRKHPAFVFCHLFSVLCPLYLIRLRRNTRNLNPLLVLINLPGPWRQSKAQPFETVFYPLANTLTHATH